MHSIKIGVYAVGAGEVVSATVTRHRKRNESWGVIDSVNMNSSDPQAERTFLVADNERLMVEGLSTVKMVYDKDQMVNRPANPGERPQGPSATLSGPVDGDESPAGDVVDRNSSPQALAAAMSQEQRDAAITAARDKLKRTQELKVQGEENADKVRRENEIQAKEAEERAQKELAALEEAGQKSTAGVGENFNPKPQDEKPPQDPNLDVKKEPLAIPPEEIKADAPMGQPSPPPAPKTSPLQDQSNKSAGPASWPPKGVGGN